MSLIFTQKEEKEDNKTDDEIATVHSKTYHQIFKYFKVTLLGLVKDKLDVNGIMQFFAVNLPCKQICYILYNFQTFFFFIKFMFRQFQYCILQLNLNGNKSIQFKTDFKGFLPKRNISTRNIMHHAQDARLPKSASTYKECH